MKEINTPNNNKIEDFESILSIALNEKDIDKVDNIVSSLNVQDLALFFNKTSDGQKSFMLNILSLEKIKFILLELDTNMIPYIIEKLGYKKVVEIIKTSDIEQVIYLLSSLDTKAQNIIINKLDQETKKELKITFSYPENTVGRIMKKSFIAVPDFWTVSEVKELLIDTSLKSNKLEQSYDIFIINQKSFPIGYINATNVFLSQDNLKISEIMCSNIQVVKTSLEEKELPQLFFLNNSINLPVVNKKNKLVGVINIHDAMKIIDKKAENQLLYTSGVTDDDMHLNIYHIIKSRLPWMVSCLLASIMCTSIIILFKDIIYQIVVLASVLPIVAAVAANAGSQTMTVTVLSLSRNEITSINAARVIFKTFIASCINGGIVSLLGGIILWMMHKDIILSMVFFLAVIGNIALSSIFGFFVPIALKKLKFDPAIASTTVVFTLTDISSFGIFLILAKKMMIG
jgi:magnesium transporter